MFLNSGLRGNIPFHFLELAQCISSSTAGLILQDRALPLSWARTKLSRTFCSSIIKIRRKKVNKEFQKIWGYQKCYRQKKQKKKKKWRKKKYTLCYSPMLTILSNFLFPEKQKKIALMLYIHKLLPSFRTFFVCLFFRAMVLHMEVSRLGVQL